MIISLLVYFQILYSVAEVYDEPQFNESERNSSQHIWHSYTFNTGAGNREELYFANVGLDSNFESISGVFAWKSLQVQDHIVVIGLGSDFITVTTLNGESYSFTYKKEIYSPAKALAVFQKWNAKTQDIESFVIVATQATEENCILKWYQIHNKNVKFLWDWPFHGNIIDFDVIKINYESRLLIVNNKGSVHKTSSVDIYSFSIEHDLDIWLFEKIILDAVPSSVTVFDNTDNVFLSASFPSLKMIHIFKYSKVCLDSLEEKHFTSHQKIFSIGLRSLISFRIGFRWYLAVASKTSLIYYIKENLLFEPVSTFKLSSFKNWLVVPVHTYREDIILLADSDSDVSVITWNGNEHLQVLGSLTELVCEDDAYCLKKMEKITLNRSAAFSYNDTQNIIISTKNGSPLFFKLHVKLKPLPDTVTLKLKNLLDLRSLLKKNYTTQKEQINELLLDKEDFVKETKDLSGEAYETTRVPETISQTKNWSEIISDIDHLKETIETLNQGVKKYLTELKSNILPQGGINSKTFLAENITDGITFYGDVLINELNLSNLNGYDVNELLTDSFRKNKLNKIGGKKVLKNLNAENVIFEKIGDTLACDVVFSDELLEEKNKNIINGDLVWQNELNILNNVMILPQISKRNVSSDKISRESPKQVYDSLNLEELEVTQDTYIQRTINGQPFILPVHSDHLNILDIVNQARVEVVKVERNLDVGFINGKNFSHLLQNLLYKPPSQRHFDTIKIDGVFSAPILQADHLNNIDLSEGTPEIARDVFTHVSDKFLVKDRNTYVRKNLKKTVSRNLKRTIHVFQNLEVDGIIFSNKINNISWAVFKDTVKKDEETVTIVGTKKFDKLLRVKNTKLSGTLNGRFADHILTNFSHQIVRFRQIYDKVKFKNLSLEGAWDGIFVNELNNSVVKLSSNNGHESNLTFKDECFVNGLNVTDFINNINLKDKKTNIKNNRTELKSIKATNVVLHGSLITDNKINNMNFSNFSLLRVSLKSPETIEHNLHHHNVTFSGEVNVQTLNLNDVPSIINSGGDTNLIEKFLNGEIHRIKKLLVKGNITTSHGINGANLSKIIEKGVRITKPSSLKGNITFENTVYFDNINVTDSIDGFSLKKLEKDIAFKHSHVLLSGPKNFSTIRVAKNIKVRSLNGHLVEEILTLKGDHIIKSAVHINGDVIVKGNVTTFAAINNINVPDLLKTYSTRVNSFICSEDLNLQGDQITIENLIVGGKIQNVSLDALINDAVQKEDSFNITGKKSFTGEVKFKGNVLVEDYIHGVNFSEFYSDIAFINVPTKFEGSIIIKEAVLKVLEISGYFNSSLINNFDTNNWLEESIPLDKYEVVDGKKFFEEAYVLDDVSVNFINGHLPSAMISLKKKQYIPSLALFPRIHTTSDISVSGFVNGWNLKKEFQDTILIRGSQTISSKTLFDQDFIVNGTLFVNSIKGKPVNSLITLDTEQIITTPLEFKGLVKAKKDVESLKIINNINLHDWEKNSVLLNRAQVLNGTWTVKGRVKANNIDGEGLLHAVSLPNISEELQKSRIMALEIKNATKVEYSDQRHKVEELCEQFSELPYLLYQFEVVDEIEISSVIDSVITFKINDENHLIVTFLNECLSAFYKWNKNSSTFDYLRQINIGPVNKWSILYRNSATYLITSSLKSSIICEENLQQANIWVFKDDSDKYTHLLSTNAFVDIIGENSTSDEFFTINENGILQQWTLQENGNISSKFLLNLGRDDYRFIDFRIMGGLAISNGREIKHITLTEDKVIENNIFLMNAHIVALPIEGKTLIAVVVKDKIVIYENILEDKIFSVIHTYRAGSVLWFNYGTKKQAFLIVASHHKLIEVYEYKSVAGLVRKMSIQMFSSRLQSEALPVRGKYQSDKFLIVIQKKKLIFIKADMLGDFYKNSDSLC